MTTLPFYSIAFLWAVVSVLSIPGIAGQDWSKTASPVPPLDDNSFSFGFSGSAPNTAISGNWAVVGLSYSSRAPSRDGSVALFQRQVDNKGTAQWVYSHNVSRPGTKPPTADPDVFGASVAMDGEWLIVGSPRAYNAADPDKYSPALYFYRLQGSTWTFYKEKYLNQNPNQEPFFFYIQQVALQGTTAAICGDHNNPSLLFLEFVDPTGWVVTGNFRGTPYWESRDQRWAQFVALDIANNQAMVGSSETRNYTGAVAFFKRNPANKQWAAPVSPFVFGNPDPRQHTWFGRNLVIRGNFAFASAALAPFGTQTTVGIVYVYQRTGDNWAMVRSFRPSCGSSCGGLAFGYVMTAIDDSTIAIGKSWTTLSFWKITSNPLTIEYLYDLSPTEVQPLTTFIASPDGSQLLITSDLTSLAIYTRIGGPLPPPIPFPATSPAPVVEFQPSAVPVPVLAPTSSPMAAPFSAPARVPVPVPTPAPFAAPTPQSTIITPPTASDPYTTALIVGIVVSVIALVVLVIVLVTLYRRNQHLLQKYRGGSSSTSSSASSANSSVESKSLLKNSDSNDDSLTGSDLSSFDTGELEKALAVANPPKKKDRKAPAKKPPQQSREARDTSGERTSENASDSSDAALITSLTIERPGLEDTNSALLKRMKIPFASLRFIRELGSGGYGTVYLGEWQHTKVAIKVDSTLNREGVADFIAEATLATRLKPHPCVVTILGISLDNKPAIIMEYCPGGSLDSLIYKEKEKPIDAEYALRLIKGIALGLLHLHNSKVTHRDLDKSGDPKITDFGFARQLNEDTSIGRTKSSFGPLLWSAPETLKRGEYSEASDVWMFGVTITEIINRELPHHDKDVLAIGAEIRDRGVSPSLREDAPLVIQQLCAMCFKRDPKARPRFTFICEFLNHLDE